MTALAVHASQVSHVPHLSWPRVGAWSGSFSLHIMVLALLLTPPVALQLQKQMRTPDPQVHIIEVKPPPLIPELPNPVRKQLQQVVKRPVLAPPVKPVIEQHSDMGVPTQVVEMPPAIEHQAATPDSEPSAITYGNTTRVAYPRESLINHEHGTVILRVLVGADGTVQAVEIEKTSGFSRLDRAARDAVRGWTFHPAVRGGVAASAWALVPVTFNLQNL